MEKALTPPEIAEVLSLPLKQVYKLAEKGLIPVAKVGRQWRALPSQLELFLKGQWEPKAPKRRPGRQVKEYPQEFNPETDGRLQ